MDKVLDDTNLIKLLLKKEQLNAASITRIVPKTVKIEVEMYHET